MKTDDADRCFIEFCNIFTNPEHIAMLVVYSDSHPSLISVCERYKLRQYHPPLGRPQANAVIERKIGIALAGMRACLASGCLPNCFWNFAGEQVVIIPTCIFSLQCPAWPITAPSRLALFTPSAVATFIVADIGRPIIWVNINKMSYMFGVR